MLLALCRLPPVFNSTQVSKKRIRFKWKSRNAHVSPFLPKVMRRKWQMLLLRHKPVSDLSIWNVFLEISHSLHTKCFQISSPSCEQKYFSRFPRWEKKPLTVNLWWPILFSLIIQQNSTWVVQQKKKNPNFINTNLWNSFKGFKNL